MHIIPLESYRTQLSSPAIYFNTNQTVQVSSHRTPDGPLNAPEIFGPASVGQRINYVVLAESINDISHGKTLADYYSYYRYLDKGEQKEVHK